jgi:hypothetical protein
LYDASRPALAAPLVALGGAEAIGMAPRAGSHSGRKVDTTNSSATATVVACAKMSQR